MDSQNNQPQGNFEIPASPGKVENAPEQAPEHLPSQELPSPSPPPVNPVATADPAALAQPAQSPVADDDSQQAPLSAGLPAAADDVDLIEKQWVDKAKKIVDKTRDDPYLQNKELSKVKADYVAQRFNKKLKTTEDNAT